MIERSFLNDENIILRSLNLEDLEGDYIKWFDDTEICVGNNHHRFPYSIENLKEYIESSYNRNLLILAIIDKKRNVHIGNVAITSIDYINSNCDFSIVIGDKNAWGKGFGYLVAKLVIEHVFYALNIKRINIGTYENNIGMINLAKKLGAVEEGIRRNAAFKNGEYVNVIEFGLLSSEYTRR